VAPRPAGLYFVTVEGKRIPREQLPAIAEAAARLEPGAMRKRPLLVMSYHVMQGFYHHLIEALPRVMRFLPQLRGGSMDVLVGLGRALVLPLLLRLGVPEASVLGTDLSSGTPQLACSRMLHVRHQSFEGMAMIGYHVRDLRQALQLPRPVGPAPGFGRVAVLSRGNCSRGVSNEAQLVQGLSSLGRTVDVVHGAPDKLNEIIETLSHAELLVGPHGANLANILYAPMNAKLLELVPRVPLPMVNNHYRTLAGILGLGYSALAADNVDLDRVMLSNFWTREKSVRSFQADVAAVKEKAASMLAGPAGDY